MAENIPMPNVVKTTVNALPANVSGDSCECRAGRRCKREWMRASARRIHGARRRYESEWRALSPPTHVAEADGEEQGQSKVEAIAEVETLEQ